VSRDGWVKRQKEVKDITSTRVREGDTVMAVLPGSTRSSVVFFSNFGVAYSSRIADIPASTGYGEPIQRFFMLKDGEKIVGALSLDPRVIGNITARKEGEIPDVHAVGVTSDGYSMRFGLESCRAEHAKRRAVLAADGAGSLASRRLPAADRCGHSRARAMLTRVDG
jgi:DNA gyrase subunit A